MPQESYRGLHESPGLSRNLKECQSPRRLKEVEDALGVRKGPQDSPEVSRNLSEVSRNLQSL